MKVMKEEVQEEVDQRHDKLSLQISLWGCMKSKVQHGGKQEVRHQSVETKVEAAAVITNEQEHMQWQHSMAHKLAASMPSNGGHFKLAVITLKPNCCNRLK